jgi:hypothetical protein
MVSVSWRLGKALALLASYVTTEYYRKLISCPAETHSLPLLGHIHDETVPRKQSIVTIAL